MAVRIRIAKDKAELVQTLLKSNAKNSGAPFETYADVIAFAAALGKKYNQRLPLSSIAKEPSPISLEIFVSRGYDLLIKLLAIAETEEPTIISAYEATAEEKRAIIFEEYANGGLEKLKNDLKGAVDYSERILLILSQIRFKNDHNKPDFDLSKFI
jgi:dnd system-associated protein 4